MIPPSLRIALASLLLLPNARSGQEGKESAASAALSETLAAACRQNQEQFAAHLTAENSSVFRNLPEGQRIRLMRRLVLLDRPGRPLLSSDAQGHAIVRCETPGLSTELRLGDTRSGENLAFIPAEVRLPEKAGGAGGEPSRRVEIGMVREGGDWKLLSVGLLLLNLAELSKQWAASELEAKEEEAIAALGEVARALGTYRRAFGKLPESLAQLGPAPKEGISPEAAGLLDREFASGEKGGYVFRYRILPSQAQAGEGEKNGDAGFELAATPVEYGKTGRRSFLLDAGGTLRGADRHGAVATASDPRIEPAQSSPVVPF